MRGTTRSKSFLVSTKTDFSFGIQKKTSIFMGKSTIKIQERPDIDSIQASDSPKSSETSSKKESVSGMEEVYNFNKSIKLNNAKQIQKLTLPPLPPEFQSPIHEKSRSNSKNFDGSTTSFGCSPILKNARRKLSILSESTVSGILKPKPKVLFPEDAFVDTLQSILSKSYFDRSEEDIQVLVRILNQISFFQTLGVEKEQKLIEKCCRFINLELEQKGNFVFKYGSQGTKFYIILKGSIGVLIPKPQAKKEDFLEIKVLKTGDSFGELALISKKPRAASILCKEDCYFAVIEKKYFYEILLDFEQKRLNNSIEFLSKYRIFNNWSAAQLSSVFLATNERKFKRGHLVFQQGDTPNDLFFVKNGEFEYRKEVTYFDGELFTEYSEIPEFLKDNFALRRSRKIGIPITRFSTGSLVGEESVFLNKPANYTLVCLSNEGCIISLNKMELFQRWNIDTFKQMMSSIKEECLRKEGKHQRRLDEYLACFTAENGPKGAKTERTNLGGNERKEEEPSNSFRSKSPRNRTLLSKNNENTTLQNVKSEESQGLKLQLRTTIRKLNNCRNLRGFSKKRSTTIMLKVIDDYERLIDQEQKEAASLAAKTVLDMNYSLSRKQKPEPVKINDPYCLISVLNPSFRELIDETSDRIKLLRRKFQ